MATGEIGTEAGAAINTFLANAKSWPESIISELLPNRLSEVRSLVLEHREAGISAATATELLSMIDYAREVVSGATGAVVLNVSSGNLFKSRATTFHIDVQGLEEGAAATIVGWIDLNGDGDFDDAAEQVLTTTRQGNGLFTFQYTPTANGWSGFQGKTIARFAIANASIPLERMKTLALSAGISEFPLWVSETPWSTLALVNGNLEFIDQFPGGKADELLISKTSQGYVFVERSGKELFVNGISGAIGDGTSLVTIPISAQVRSIRLLTGGGDDHVVFDASSKSDPIPGGGVEAALGTGYDILRLTNNSSNNTWWIREGGQVKLSLEAWVRFASPRFRS